MRQLTKACHSSLSWAMVSRSCTGQPVYSCKPAFQVTSLLTFQGTLCQFMWPDLSSLCCEQWFLVSTSVAVIFWFSIPRMQIIVAFSVTTFWMPEFSSLSWSCHLMGTWSISSCLFHLALLCSCKYCAFASDYDRSCQSWTSSHMHLNCQSSGQVVYFSVSSCYEIHVLCQT